MDGFPCCSEDRSSTKSWRFSDNWLLLLRLAHRDIRMHVQGRIMACLELLSIKWTDFCSSPLGVMSKNPSTALSHDPRVQEVGEPCDPPTLAVASADSPSRNLTPALYRLRTYLSVHIPAMEMPLPEHTTWLPYGPVLTQMPEQDYHFHLRTAKCSE
jgi:hypothetical protein